MKKLSLALALCLILLLSGCGPTPTPTPVPTATPAPTPSGTLTGDVIRADNFSILAYDYTPQSGDYMAEALMEGVETSGTITPKSAYEGDYAAYLAERQGKWLLDTRDVYYSVRNYALQGDTLKAYINNLLTIRQQAVEKQTPFYTLLTAGRQEPQHIQYATALSAQGFLSLGLGASGVAWAGYQNDRYTPLDEDGFRTETWYHLRDANRRLKIFADIMKDLTVECVYFQGVGESGLPYRPSSSFVTRVEYNIKGKMLGNIPLMLVELSGQDGSKWLYVANLSTTQSVYPRYTFKSAVGFNANNFKRVSPATGSLLTLNATKVINETHQITQLGVHDTCITAGSAELYQVK